MDAFVHKKSLEERQFKVHSCSFSQVPPCKFYFIVLHRDFKELLDNQTLYRLIKHNNKYAKIKLGKMLFQNEKRSKQE